MMNVKGYYIIEPYKEDIISYLIVCNVYMLPIVKYDYLIFVYIAIVRFFRHREASASHFLENLEDTFLRTKYVLMQVLLKVNVYCVVCEFDMERVKL